MKYAFIAAGAAVLIASVAIAVPFPQPQSSSTVATQLGYSSVKYTIPANSHTSFALPVTNRPIHMMVTCTTGNIRGVGSVTIVSLSGAPQDFLEWTGSDYGSTINGKTTDSGAAALSGTHMMYADAFQTVDVQVNSPTAVRIVNNFSTMPVTVVVTIVRGAPNGAKIIFSGQGIPGNFIPKSLDTVTVGEYILIISRIVPGRKRLSKSR